MMMMMMKLLGHYETKSDRSSYLSMAEYECLFHDGLNKMYVI